VRQWRLAIELRADRAAIKTLTAPERKSYAALLLEIKRPSARGHEALPCPTARFNSAPHRHAKMRLIAIMEGADGVKKRRWSTAIVSTFCTACGLGILSAGATANEAATNAGLSPEDYVLIGYVKQTPLQMPENCPGLIEDLKARDVRVEEKDLSINGQPVSQKTMTLGTVLLSHDVRKDGRIFNPRTLASTHPCFEASARAAITQWMAAPQGAETRNVAVKMHFVISGATGEELNRQLFAIVQ